MPANVTGDPLGIAAVFSDGSGAGFTFSKPSCPRLVRDLLAALAGMVYPHGELDAADSVRLYVAAIRNMAAVLAAGGFTGAAGDLTRGQIAQYWLGAPAWAEGCTRRLVQACGRAGLAAGVADLAGGHSFNVRDTRPLAPYGETEWTALTRACAGVVAESYQAHREALAAAAGGADPASAGWSADNLRWLLSRWGPSTVETVSAHAGLSVHVARRRGGHVRASTELFPHTGVVVAYRLLFGVYSGLVPDGIDDLVTTGIDWAGDATVLLSYVKGRTAAESVNLPKAAVRLLEQWLSHSALLRSFLPAGQRNALWPRTERPTGDLILTSPPAPATLQGWIRRHEVASEDGVPLKIHRHRIRTTHEAMRDTSAWWGSRRGLVDPNHSPRSEGDHYLSAPTPRQRQLVDQIITDAQQDLLRRARPPTVVTSDQAADLLRGYPQLVAALKLTDQVIAELTGGERDVFTAACADQLSGLHGPKGKPCPARPWVCLLCPLAVFAPRHALNLVRLQGFFTRQWQAMPSAQFMAVFGPYAARLDEILAGYDPALLAASAPAGPGDDMQIPLRPEERPA
ncbi:MAG TPA: hypothetical protein DHU96_35375 [Actinobacteria bacterium]|nr:hypothetical protein [Actinomycetota bacterium]